MSNVVWTTDPGSSIGSPCTISISMSRARARLPTVMYMKFAFSGWTTPIRGVSSSGGGSARSPHIRPSSTLFSSVQQTAVAFFIKDK